MRILGIDYGTKRVGIALSNEDGTMAFPKEVITNDAALLKNLEAIIVREGVEVVVIGHSLNTDGRPNPVQADIEALMLDLTLGVGLPVHLVPEQYTTQAALRIQGRTDMTDASAAALILNTYLEQQR